MYKQRVLENATMTFSRALVCFQAMTPKIGICARHCRQISKLTFSFRFQPAMAFHSSRQIEKRKMAQAQAKNVTPSNERESKTGGKKKEFKKMMESNTSIKVFKKKPKSSLNSVLKPVDISPDDTNTNDIGTELTGKLDKVKLLKVLVRFYTTKEMELLALENGLNKDLYHQVFISFRRYCKESKSLPTELHVILSDIISGNGHETDIFPYFLNHARQMYPHLDCKDDLEKISDLTLPANWYPEARAMKRKIVYHAGPTNSGKTYHALKRFYNAESGVYCGPLRMLANEVFYKSNSAVSLIYSYFLKICLLYYEDGHAILLRKHKNIFKYLN